MLMAEAVRKRLKLFRRTSGSPDPVPIPERPAAPTPNYARPKSNRKASFHTFTSRTHDRAHGHNDEMTAAAAAAAVAAPLASHPIAPEPKIGANGDSSNADHPDYDAEPDISQRPTRPPTLLIEAPSSPDLLTSQKAPNGRPPSSKNVVDPSEPDTKPPARPVSTRPPLTRTSTKQSYIGMSGTNTRPSTRDSQVNDDFVDALQSQPRKMSKRKVWVRRPGASATLIQFHEDDLVDDVRDTILRKYANSLGKAYDSPDMTLKVQPRERSNHAGHERTLGPEEPMQNLLEAYFPGGQDVGEALVIDVPQRRTPRVSPRIIARHTDYFDDARPAEEDTGYFPPMPVGQLTPQGRNHYPHPHSIGILETGQAPKVPSPREKRTRPRPHRQHTSSPTIVNSTSTPQAAATHYHTPRQPRTRRDSNDRLKSSTHAPQAPPLPTSPPTEVPAAALTTGGKPVGTPPATTHPAAAAVSPRLTGGSSVKPKKTRKPLGRREAPTREITPSHLNGESEGRAAVPPINVLIVEDNIINLKVLEMMVGKLKVRWSTAMNGRDAVTKWREGGFHLVLMDIQLPIMSGLEATKEIRRLERVNGIGVFTRADHDESENDGIMGDQPVNGIREEVPLERKPSKETKVEDKLVKGGVFKSPVIIVALTASSLQSDRREALAAGCNDFLTKVRGLSFPYPLGPYCSLTFN